MKDDLLAERLTRLILLLAGNNGHSITEISEKLKVSERQAYRYIEQMQNAGLVITKNSNGYLKIDKTDPYQKDIADLLYFSKEESYILSQAIHSISNDTLLKDNLVKKLYSIYDFERVPQVMVRKANSEIIHELITAIKDKRMAVLLNYHSSNSSSTTDRLIEPFEFTTNLNAVWAYEEATHKNKIFKIQRIGKVESVGNKWRYEKRHKTGLLDPFRMSGSHKIRVKMTLSYKARNLMIEEYPLTEAMIKQTRDKSFVFDGWVCALEGIGRFVLGLPEDIEVIKPLKFKAFLNEKIKNKVF